jgi:hypothetical protein
MGGYLALCSKLERALSERQVGGTVDPKIFKPDASIPLPGTTLEGQMVELLQYSDATLSIDIPKRKPLGSTAQPFAKAALMEWATECIEQSGTDFIPADEAFDHYYHWCLETGRRASLNKNHFGREMVRAFVPKELPNKERFKWFNGRAVRIYPGIRFKQAQST